MTDHDSQCTTLGGLAVGALELIHMIMIGLCAEPSDLGLASGVTAAARQVGGSIAGALILFIGESRSIPGSLTDSMVQPASIYVTILQNRIAIELPKHVITAATDSGLPESGYEQLLAAVSNGTAAAMAAVPGINAQVEAAVASATTQAWASSFRMVYLISIIFGGIAFIASFFTKSVDQYMTGQIARKLQGTHGTNPAVDEELQTKVNA